MKQALVLFLIFIVTSIVIRAWRKRGGHGTDA